jgi:heterodisulfide reductase subunit C
MVPRGEAQSGRGPVPCISDSPVAEIAVNVRRRMSLSMEATLAEQVREFLQEETRGANLHLCQVCGSCVSRCHLRDVLPEVNPRKIVRLTLSGCLE